MFPRKLIGPVRAFSERRKTGLQRSLVKVRRELDQTQAERKVSLARLVLPWSQFFHRLPLMQAICLRSISFCWAEGVMA